MKKGILIGILIILGCILVLVPANTVATQYVWSEFAWEYNAESEISSGIVVGSDGVIYFGTVWPAADKIVAVNPNGTLKWEYGTTNSIRSGIALSNDESVVYGGDLSSGLYAIYTTNGSLKWKYDPSIVGGIWSGISVDDNDNIYFGSEIESLYSIYYNGTLRWNQTFSSGYECNSQITINESVGYTACGAHFIKFNLSNGSAIWDGETGGQGTGVSISNDNIIYWGNYDKIKAIYSNGTLKWEYAIGHLAMTANAIGSDGRLWSVDCNGANTKIVVLNPDGTLSWEYNVPDWVGSEYDTTGLALDLNNVVYVGCYDNNLYAVNPDGTLKWIFTAGDDIRSGIAFSPDEDTVYFGSDDGYLYAITTHRFDPSHGIYGNVYLLPLYSAGKDTAITCKNESFSTSTIANTTGYYQIDNLIIDMYWINASLYNYIDNSALVEVVSGYNQTLLDGCDAL